MTRLVSPTVSVATEQGRLCGPLPVAPVLVGYRPRPVTPPTRRMTPMSPPAPGPGPLPAGLCDAGTTAAALGIPVDVVRHLATSNPGLLPEVHWVDGQPCFSTDALTARSR